VGSVTLAANIMAVPVSNTTELLTQSIFELENTTALKVESLNMLSKFRKEEVRHGRKRGRPNEVDIDDD